MSSKSQVPDAWDDDWVNQADKGTATTNETTGKKAKLSKAERRAQQAEVNRKLWEEADESKPAFVVDSRNDVIPPQSGFRPGVTVLSRKPAPAAIAKRDPASALEQLSVEDDDDDPGDATKEPTLTPEERQLKLQREREEKQRKYDEARERLFGSSSQRPPSGSTASSPAPSGAQRGARGRGRGRGGGEGRDGSSRPGSGVDTKQRQLFDPNDPKPGVANVPKKDAGASDSGRSTPVEELVVRQPRGPDGSGRGGHGFVNRGRGRPSLLVE